MRIASGTAPCTFYIHCAYFLASRAIHRRQLEVSSLFPPARPRLRDQEEETSLRCLATPHKVSKRLKTYQGHVVAQSSVCLVVRASWSLKTSCCQTRGERCCCFAPAPSLRVPIIAGGRIATETPYSLVQVGPAFVIFCYLSEPAQHLLRSHAGYPGGAPGGQGGYGQGPPQVRAYCRVRSFACWSPVRWPCMPLMCKVVCGVLPSFHCSLCPYLRGCMHLQGYGYQQGPPQGAYPQQVVPHVLHHACHRCMPTAMRQPIEGIALCHLDVVLHTSCSGVKMGILASA